jgi:hypothetical protein
MKVYEGDVKDLPKDQFVLIKEKNGIGQFLYVPSNYDGPIALDATLDATLSEDEDLR